MKPSSRLYFCNQDCFDGSERFERGCVYEKISSHPYYRGYFRLLDTEEVSRYGPPSSPGRYLKGEIPEKEDNRIFPCDVLGP